MKKFNEKTESGSKQESSVKKGSFLPPDAVALGWFDAGSVNPGNTLSVTDFSTLYRENYSLSFERNSNKIMYADEFGVLRYANTNEKLDQFKHSPIVDNPEVSISNTPIGFDRNEIDARYGFNGLFGNYTSRLDAFAQEDFAHSIYVSRYYTLVPNTVSSFSDVDSLSGVVRRPERFGIRVVDSQGKDYVNELGNKRYRVMLEAYPKSSAETVIDEEPVVEVNSSSLYAPLVGLEYCRIVLALDEPDPAGLYLVYDKVERNQDGIPYRQINSYKEYINCIPYYSSVIEESEVIDPSSLNRKVYSSQLFSQKENKLLKTKSDNDGWKIVTPRKAIQDPRTFQNFNWRLLAKINYDFRKAKDINNVSERSILKVAVLYSGSIQSIPYPYIFANLEESVINQQNFLFENPLAPSGGETLRVFSQSKPRVLGFKHRRYKSKIFKRFVARHLSV